MKNLFSKRFRELVDDGNKIEAKKTKWYDSFAEVQREQVDEHALLNWKTRATHLISAACGESSEHFKLFKQQQTGFYGTNLDTLRNMLAVLRAAQEDFDGGYLTKIQVLVQAELFDSELEQASELLKNGFKMASAVVAGVVLETALGISLKREPICLWKRNMKYIATTGQANTLINSTTTCIQHTPFALRTTVDPRAHHR